MMPDISVLIVNYNTASLISACLTSVLAQKTVSIEIIVVDNASADNSLSVLHTFAPHITLIASEKNLGFGKANNLAAKKATGKYLYLLNPDASLKTPDTLATLSYMMACEENLGLIGTPLLNGDGHNEGEPKYHYPDAQHLHHPLPTLPGKIAWVIGASMMIRRDIFNRLQGFDEDFFLYGEEVDLCWRIREAGFHIAYCRETPVFHLGGGSERQTDIYALTLKKQNGLHLFYQKHYAKGDVQALLKKNRRRAYFRLQSNRLFYTLTRQKKYAQKQKRYQAIYDSTCAFQSE